MKMIDRVAGLAMPFEGRTVNAMASGAVSGPFFNADGQEKY
jgi:hypothetical protein